MFRSVLALLAAGLAALGVVVLLGATDDDSPSRRSATAAAPAADEPARRSLRRPSLVEAAIEDYLATLNREGGRAACRLFPREFVATADAPAAPHSGSPYNFPHPAPNDGCQSRQPPSFSHQPTARWDSVHVLRIDRVGFVEDLARVKLRARTTFKPPRDRLPGPDPLPGVGDCSRLPQVEGELYDQCGDPVDAVPPAVDEDVVWLSVRDGRWQVARPSLVTYRVFDWRTHPGDVFDQPVSEGVRARPARPGHPGLECSGASTRVTDPAGDASGPKGARDWVDVTAVELARSAASLCLAVTTRTPLRPLSGISVYYEQASLMKTTDGRQVSQGGLPGAFGVRLNSRGRPEAFGGRDGPEGRYAELPEARVGGGGRTLTIEFPNARRLGLTRQPFAWMLTASVEVSPGRLASDRLPDARTRLFFAHPGGKRVVEAPDARP